MSATDPTNEHPPQSRYHGLEVVKGKMGDGRRVVYLRRRFVPLPETLALLAEHVVHEGERLDNITALHLGDPEQFWRVCDANNAMWPATLTAETGRPLRITLPPGIPEAPRD